MDNISKTIDTFLALNELGKTDARKLNQLVGLLDATGSVDTEKAVKELYPKSKDSHAAFRNFTKRVRTAIADTAEDMQDSPVRQQLKSLEIHTSRKTRSAPSRLTITAAFIRPDIVPAGNRHYDEENYVNTEGTDIKDREVPENTIKLFLSFAINDDQLPHIFKRCLEAELENLAKKLDKPIMIWTMKELLPNSNFKDQIDNAMQACHYGFAALSKAYLNSDFIRKEELPYLLEHNKLIAFGLNSRLDDKPASSEDFFNYMNKEFEVADNTQPGQTLAGFQVYHLTDPLPGAFFNSCISEETRKQFASGLVKKLEEIMKQNTEAPIKPKPGEVTLCPEDSRYIFKKFEDLDAKELIIMDSTEKYSHSDELNMDGKKSSIPLIPDMLDWTINGQNPIYAILGDYGMGKTFSCRIFADKLLSEHKKNSALPAPLYMDLRDIPTFITDENGRRQPRLEEMLAEIIRRFTPDGDAASCLDDIRNGRIIPIFDGLDEKLVFYTQDMQSQFLKELMRVFPARGTRADSAVKLVLSCRSHYFEKITSQASFLQGLGRSDSKSGDFRAMEILPLSENKMKQLLEKLLGKEEASRMWEFLGSHQYLAELGSRPFLLSKMPAVLPRLKAMREKNIPLNAAVLYNALIKDVLYRDDEKHILKKRHKHRILQDLAVHFWENNAQRMNIDDLNDWYQAWLHRDADIFAQYETSGSGQLEKDLRNSTLLLRFGEDEFGFTHSSMQEYFLARGLLDKWKQPQNGFTLQKPVSKLTEQFIGESLSMLKDRDRQLLNETLTAYAASPDRDNHSPIRDSLLLGMVTALADATLPLPDFTECHFFDVQIQQTRLRGTHARRLVLNNCQMPLSRWQECRIDHLELNDTNITQSVWEQCRVGETSGRLDAQRLTCIRPQGDLSELYDSPVNRTYPVHGGSDKFMSPGLYEKNNIMFGHSSGITSLAYSPDGRLLASGSIDGTVRLWTTDGELCRTLEGHSDSVRSVHFSPDGRLLASGSIDGTVRLWTANGELCRTMEGHSGIVWSVSYSPDGCRIASGSIDGKVRVWTVEGDLFRTLEGHTGPVWSVSYSPGGRLLASGSEDGTVRVWEVDGDLRRTLEGHSSPVMSMSYSPDGRLLASGGYDGTVRLWTTDGEFLRSLEGHSGPVWSVSYSPDGRLLASGGYDGTVRLWTTDGDLCRTLEGHSRPVMSVSYSPDGRLLASGSYDGTVRVWTADGEFLHSLEGHSGIVLIVSYSPNGHLLASGSVDGKVRVWSTDGELCRSLEGHSEPVLSVSYSPDGRLLASGSADGKVRVWTSDGELLRTLEGHSGTVRSVSYSPDGHLLASGSIDGTVRLWTTDGDLYRSLESRSGPVISVSYSPDGHLLASGSIDGTVRLWTTDGDLYRSLESRSGTVRSVSYSPDGRLLASGSDDGTVRLWTTDGDLWRTLKGHTGRVRSVSYSPDGHLLASGSEDGTVRVWTTDGEFLRSLEGHSGVVWSVQFSLDGQFLASSGDDGLIIIWQPDRDFPRRIMGAAADGQRWSVEIDENRRFTRMLGTELVWQRVWMRHKDGLASMDAFKGFEFVPSRQCLTG